MKLPKKLNNKAFSHIELVLVILVIGLIAGIGLFVKNRVEDRNSKAESRVVKPVPVYRLNYNYPGTNKIRDYDYAVGTDALKRAIDNNGKNNVRNMGVVFLAFPSGSNAGETLYKLYLSGGGVRTDNSKGKSGAKTVLFTTNKYVKDDLISKFGFKKYPINARLLDTNFAYKDIVPIKRLWKTVTKDDHRLYRYSTNSSEVTKLKSSGYNLDEGSSYGPSIKKYCNMRKTNKYGQICTPKNYKLPDLDAFNDYIKKSLFNDYLRQVQLNQIINNSSRGGSAGGGSTGSGSSRNTYGVVSDGKYYNANGWNDAQIYKKKVCTMVKYGPKKFKQVCQFITIKR